MRIVCDGRMAQMGGIGTYICQLAQRLPVSLIAPKVPIYSLREQMVLPFAIGQCDLFWAPHFNVSALPILAKRFVMTIHDLYHLDAKERYPKWKRMLLRGIIERGISRAEKIITVSAFSKSRILDHFPGAPVEVALLGGDHLNGCSEMAVKGVSTPFYLTVGGNRPHKNVRWLKSQMGSAHLIDLLGQYLPGQVKWLYTRAEALIVPSFYEGFGLPVVEAMHLGCPVVSSTAGSLPEVAGDAALFFDPGSERELKRALDGLQEKRQELIGRGRDRAAQFTWRRSAQQHTHLLLGE